MHYFGNLWRIIAALLGNDVLSTILHHQITVYKVCKTLKCKTIHKLWWLEELALDSVFADQDYKSYKHWIMQLPGMWLKITDQYGNNIVY